MNKNSLLSINTLKVQAPFTSGNIQTVNTNLHTGSASASHAAAGSRAPSSGQKPSVRQQQLPPLLHPAQKGQKVSLCAGSSLTSVSVCLGWNTVNHLCDVDVSAFLLDGSGKVPGDAWFVFYGQTESPDASTTFEADGTADREIVHINFARLHSSVKKIVFVLTINEAFEKRLNFGMLKDAYIRILNDTDKKELVSFKMTEYYSNVISMMIGEIYLHNGNWKFHAVGNGVAKDLAGLCGLYGVQVQT